MELPFAAPYASPGLGTPPNQRTPREFANLLKTRLRPAPIGGKKPKEFRWVTTCLTSDPTEDTTPKYSDWEANASLYVDIHIRHDIIRHSGLEGQSSTTARVLLVFIACKLQQFLHNSPPEHAVDMEALSDLADSFSFSETRKRTMQSRVCSVFCDTTSDQVTLMSTMEASSCLSDTCPYM